MSNLSGGWNVVEHFQTSRLSARPISADDFDLLRQLHGDRRVMATLSVDGSPHSTEATREMLARYCRQWRSRSFGLWMFREQARNDFVGYCGLLESDTLDRPAVALAYAVTAAHWRRGFAREMAQAVLDEAFNRLELSEVIVYTLPRNFGSRKVIQSLGFEYSGEIIHAGLPHVLFHTTEPPSMMQAKDYRNRTGGRTDSIATF